MKITRRSTVQRRCSENAAIAEKMVTAETNWLSSDAARRQAKVTVFAFDGEDKESQMTAAEIVAAVRDERPVFWAHRGTIVSNLNIAVQDSEKARQLIRKTGGLLVHGTIGLAAHDLAWDWKPTFTCSKPTCQLTHDSDELTFENLIHQTNLTPTIDRAVPSALPLGLEKVGSILRKRTLKAVAKVSLHGNERKALKQRIREQSVDQIIEGYLVCANCKTRFGVSLEKAKQLAESCNTIAEWLQMIVPDDHVC